MAQELQLKTIKQPLSNHGFTLVESLLSFGVLILFVGLIPFKYSISPPIPTKMIEATIIQTQLAAIASKQTKSLPFLVNQKVMSFNHRGNISQAIKGKATIYNQTIEITIWLGFGRFNIE